MITDQVLLSRLLTADRHKDDPWWRTCIVLRPFHAVAKKLAEQYSKVTGETPADLILKRAKNKDGDSTFERDSSWLREGEFRGHNDPFVQMLRNCWYAGCYIGCVPRLDLNNVLPRSELILPVATIENGEFPTHEVKEHLDRLFSGLRSVKFDVSADHSMFQTLLKIDVLPSILIRVHEVVKIWAAELASRVNEYIGFYIKRHIGDGQHRGIRVRPWTGQELKRFAAQLQTERDLQAGVRRSTTDESPELPPADV